MNPRPIYLFLPIHYFLKVLSFTLIWVPIQSQSQVNPFYSCVERQLKFLNQLNTSIEHSLNWTNFNKPWVQRLEFRTETNEFLLNQQEYLFRLTFNNFLENKYPNKIADIEKSVLFEEAKQFTSEQIYSCYKKILRIYELDTLIKSNNSKYTLLKTLRNYFALQLTEKPGSLYDITNIDLELFEIDLSSQELSHELESISNYLQINIPTHLPQLPSLDQLIPDKLNYYHEHNGDSVIYHHKYATKELSFQQKQSSNNQLLEYFQMRYNAHPEDLLKEKFSIGVGLRIPFIIRNDYIKENYRLELLKDQLKERTATWKWQSELEELKSNLVNTKKLMNNTFLQTDSLNIRLMRTSANGTYPLEPEEVLKLKLSLETLKKYQIRLSYRFLGDYLQYLHSSGQFILNPDLYFLEWPHRRI